MRKFLIGKMNNLYYEYRNDKHYEHNIENKDPESSVMEKKTHRFKQNAKSKHETDKPLDLVISSKNEDKNVTKRLKRTALPNPDTEPASKRSNVVNPAESASKVAQQPQSSAAREDLPMENSCTSEIPAGKSDERSCAKETEHVENSTQERPSVIRNTLNLMNSSTDPKILADPAFFTGLFTVIRDLHKSSVMTYSLIDHLSKTLIDNTKTMESVKKLLVGSHNSVSNTPTASSSKASTTEVEKISEIKTNKKQKEQDDEGNDCNEVLKRKRCHKRKFVLPLEYDENDSRWTLKYREMAPGLVELMPHTNVYINAVKLSNCKRLSKDCNSLARMLLLEIFTQSALSICSLTGLRARAYDVEGAAVRPGLDENARTVLLTFVEEYGREKGWITVDTSSIQNCLRNKMTEMRSRYVM